MIKPGFIYKINLNTKKVTYLSNTYSVNYNSYRYGNYHNGYKVCPFEIEDKYDRPQNYSNDFMYIDKWVNDCNLCITYSLGKFNGSNTITHKLNEESIIFSDSLFTTITFYVTPNYKTLVGIRKLDDAYVSMIIFRIPNGFSKITNFRTLLDSETNTKMVRTNHT